MFPEKMVAFPSSGEVLCRFSRIFDPGTKRVLMDAGRFSFGVFI